jgi:hypothetical protein
MSTSLLSIKTHTSHPIRINNAEVRVRTQVIQLRLPVVQGGLIWNRPLVVVLRTSDNQEQILSIPDLTRIAMLILAGLSFASMFFWIFFRLRKIES